MLLFRFSQRETIRNYQNAAWKDKELESKDKLSFDSLVVIQENAQNYEIVKAKDQESTIELFIRTMKNYYRKQDRHGTHA